MPARFVVVQGRIVMGRHDRGLDPIGVQALVRIQLKLSRVYKIKDRLKDNTPARPNPICTRKRRSKKYHAGLTVFQSTSLSILSLEAFLYTDTYSRAERDVHAGENHGKTIEDLNPNQVNTMRDWTSEGSHNRHPQWDCEESRLYKVMVALTDEVTHLNHDGSTLLWSNASI